MSLGNSNIHQRGDIPEILKLPNDRIRVTRRFQKFTREDVDNANLGSLMGDFGALDTTDEQISGQGYTNCRLISVEVDTRFNSQANSDNAVLVKTYETLTSDFVEITDPTVSTLENGLKKITKVYRAISGTTSTGVVGTSSLSTGEILASSEIEDNTAFSELTEIYIESGTLSETLDNVGSQKAKVIETIGADPATPSGYSLASKQESNFEGFQTNRFTFLKNNVILSESEDKVGSQLAITQEVFNGTPTTPSGYSIASEQESDVGGIPTRRYTFLKEDVKLSASEDEVGSQNAITEQWFKPSESRETKADYSLARKEESDVDGIPTERYTFLKDDVKLSQSEDKVGSQKAIAEQWFKPATSRETKTGYSLARTEVSDVDGIATKRFTFLKNNVVLSVSEDKVGSQKAVVNEVFNPTSEAITGIDTSGVALIGYNEADRAESDYEGIKTIRVRFLKPNILSLSQEFGDGQKKVSVQTFNVDVAATRTALSQVTNDHVLLSQNESDFAGIKTNTFEFQLDESFTEDYELNGLKRISLVELSSSDFTAQTIGGLAGVTSADPPVNVVPVGSPSIGLYLASQKIDNGGAIKVRESVWLEAGQLSVSEENGPSGLPSTKTRKYTSQISEPTSNGIILSRQTDNSSGYKIYTYSFLEGGALGSSPTNTSGEIISYQKNIEVRQAGVVGVASSSVTGGNIASLTVVPPSIKTVTANVSIKLVTTSTVAAPTAYNLSGTSCSASILSSRNSPVGIEQGSGMTASVYNNSYSANTRSFPNSYRVGGGATGTVTSNAQIIRDNDNIIGKALTETVTTVIDLSGSNSAPSTSGVYQEDIDPAFIDGDGNQQYRKTTYTIPAS